MSAGRRFESKRVHRPSSLEMPERRCGFLATGFNVKLPRTKGGKNSVTTWVDRLTRRAPFNPSTANDTAVDVANSSFSNIFMLHGLPDITVPERDPKFVSKFWNCLLDLCGIKLKMSTSRHAQTDGASEVVNRMIGNYLRCYISYPQNDWDGFLPTAEFAYNSAVN